MHKGSKYTLRRESSDAGALPMELSSGKFWQTSEYQIIPCKLSNNDIYFNISSTRFLIMPIVSIESILLAVKEIEAGFKTKLSKSNPNLTKEFIKNLDDSIIEITKNPGILSLGLMIDKLWRYAEIGKDGAIERNTAGFVRYVFYDFYYHNILAFPNNEIICKNRSNIVDFPWKCDGMVLKVFSKIANHAITKSGVKAEQGMIKRISCMTNIKSLVDLDPFVLSFIINSNNFTKNQRTVGFINGLIRAIQQEKPEIVLHPHEYLGTLRTSDNIFNEININTINNWATLAQRYYESEKHGKAQRKVAVRYFLKHILQNTEIPKNPEEFFDKSNEFKLDISDNLDNRVKLGIFKFLEWAFRDVCCLPDDNGDPVCIDSKRWAIPMEPVVGKRYENLGKTSRLVMPADIVAACEEIVLGNDFSWAKSFSADYFRSGSGELIWSPVRAIALVTKLAIPLRTRQVLTMGSGEGDTWRYEADKPYDLACGPESGTFHRNNGPFASKKVNNIVQEGAFRRVERRDGNYSCHIFVNNNKTADMNKDVSNHGYVMPWEEMKAIGYLLYLRDWQEKYNNNQFKVRWNDVEWLRRNKDFTLMENKRTHFLFRDPSNERNPNKLHPLTPARLGLLWNELIGELERRMNLTLGSIENPSPYQFVFSRDERGRPSKVKWDLHSMRVTILSYLHDNGVPLEYLKELAGHSSIQMTSYYSVIDPEKMVDVLNEATANWKRMATSEWGTFLRGIQREKVRDLLVARDAAVLEQVFLGDRDGITVMDHGLCLVGQSMCHQGLEVLDEDGKATYVPVPGGKGNCVRCRYFATGPAWLPGLVAHFNWLTLRVTKESRILDPLKEKYELLMDEFREGLRECKPFTKRQELDRARNAYDASMAKTNELGHSWQATYRLWEQARELVRRENERPGNSLSLIVQGGIETMEFALQKCHPTDLLARICQTANLFPGVSQSYEANQDLCCSLDKMLFNNGIPGLLVTLGEEEKRVAAIEIWKWLRQRTRSNDEFTDVVDCRSTLESLGFRWEFLQKLETLEPFSFHLSRDLTGDTETKPRVKAHRRQTIGKRDHHEED